MATTFLIPDLDIEKAKNTELSRLVKRTIKSIYIYQGFYAALNFIIKAGLAPGNDQAQAEKFLTSVIGRHDKA